MQRRLFLKLSAAGAAAGVLWGCSDGSSSDGGGGVMLMTNGPGAPRMGGGASATSGGGAAYIDEDAPVQAQPTVTREVHVMAPNAAFAAYDRQGYGYEIEPFGGRVVERGMLGVLLREFGSFGMGDSQLNQPVALAFGPDDNLYVLDRGNHRVQVFDRAGNHLRQIGGYGSDLGQLSYPQDLLFDAKGHLFVADTLNHRVQVFDVSGRALSLFGTLGSEDGELNGPNSLALDADGSLHVLDSGNGRVQVFELDAQLGGNFVRGYGEWGTEPGQLSLPRSLALTKDGTAIVADVANATLEVWKPDGRFEQRFVPRFDDGDVAAPVDVAVAPDGDLYISAVPAAA
jgi:tripartite motif-containing protein 71